MARFCPLLHSRLALATLAAAAAAASAAAPPVALYPNVNAAYSLDFAKPAASAAFVKHVGDGLGGVAACAAAAAAWANASAPSQRCLAATFFRAPSNASFVGQCWCIVNEKWVPLSESGADSARLLWPCESERDCSYNGACGADGACECDAAWGGPRCGELQLLPVDPAQPGLRLVGADGRNISTWGAPMLRDPATGTWHAWASEMEYGCGINSWQTNSHVVHATAAAPGGPWTRKEEVFAAFAHEPDVVLGPKGELVMALSYFAEPNSSDFRCTQCANGVTLSEEYKNGCGPNRSHGFRQLVAVSPGFDEPFGAPFEVVALSLPWDWNTAITILPNGSAVGVLRALFPWFARNYADNKTWHAVGNCDGCSQGPALPDSNVEDPCIYVDRRGVFHTVMHSMDAGLEYCGGHAFSTDGVNWHYTGMAYGNNVSYSDGSWQYFTRRERPHLLFADDGVTPIALSNGVQYAVPDVACTIDGAPTLCDPIFTLVQRIVQPSEARQ
jgi:hypothetical protein